MCQFLSCISSVVGQIKHLISRHLLVPYGCMSTFFVQCDFEGPCFCLPLICRDVLVLSMSKFMKFIALYLRLLSSPSSLNVPCSDNVCFNKDNLDQICKWNPVITHQQAFTRLHVTFISSHCISDLTVISSSVGCPEPWVLNIHWLVSFCFGRSIYCLWEIKWQGPWACFANLACCSWQFGWKREHILLA